MRLSITPLFLAVLLLAGCANHGVIVQKESRSHPFYESVGVEGMYTFLLRDETGVTHRQMVTPEVYERYAIGDNFNDEQVAPATNDASEPKTVQVAGHRPTFAVGRMANATKTVSTQRVAAVKSATTKTKVAHHSMQHATKRIASHHSQKKTSHTQVANRARTRAKLVAMHSKKSKTVAVAKRIPKPWKLTEPTIETAASQPAPPAEGPASATAKKPAMRETQVDIPDSQ